MNLTEIKSNLESIRSAMDIVASLDNPQGIAEKLENLSNITGLSAECIAHSRRHLDKRLQMLVLNKAYKDYSASDKKMIFAGEASEEIFCVNYSESINKDVHYELEALRSLLSYLKEEMKQIK